MHIALVAASAPSHMHSHLAVVRELVQRGLRVSYLVSSHLAELARTTGADVVGCTSVLPGAPGAPTEWPGSGRGGGSGPAVAGMRLFLDEAIHVLPQVHAALDTDRPDIVLYDIGGMAGPVAAERLGVPAIQVSPSMVAWDGERYRFVGPCIDPRREDPGDWTPPPGDGPLTLPAFGSSYTDRIDLYRNAIDALEGTGWRLTIATGRVAPDRLGAVPDWVQVRAMVPQPAVLSAADAFVTHAGMGSCTEALWYAVPMVAIPQAVDQPLNAAQLETLGVGRHLTADSPDPAEIRDAIRYVAIDPEVRRRLDGIRDELHSVGGPVHAADAIEDVAAGRW